MEVYSTPPLLRPQRSLSYNDLKKRRLMRSSHSQKKLDQHTIAQSTVKKIPSSDGKLQHAINYQAVKECISQLKGVLATQNSSKRRTIVMKESKTDRPKINKKTLQTSRQTQDMMAKQTIKDHIKAKDSMMWSTVEQSGDTKQLIRRLLDKNKSKRKLTELREVRNRLKQEKERSQSKTTRVMQIPSPVKDQERIRSNSLKHSSSRKKTDKTNVPSLQHSNQSPGKYSPLNDDVKRNSQPYQINSKNIPKQPENIQSFDGFSAIKDVSQIILKGEQTIQESALQTLGGWCRQDSIVPGSFLSLLRNSDCLDGRQMRLKGQLQRVKRIFPVGFFGK